VRGLAFDITPYLDILGACATKGCTVSMEENARELKKVESVLDQMLRWIRSSPGRAASFKVYKIDASRYGALTNRMRCIFTNFPIPGETNLAESDMCAGDGSTADETHLEDQCFDCGVPWREGYRWPWCGQCDRVLCTDCCCRYSSSKGFPELFKIKTQEELKRMDDWECPLCTGEVADVDAAAQSSSPVDRQAHSGYHSPPPSSPLNSKATEQATQGGGDGAENHTDMRSLRKRKAPGGQS